MSDAVEKMGESPWSGLLRDEYLQKIAPYLEYQSVDAGELIFARGAPCKYVYWIIDGAVEITESDSISLAVLAKGQLFGEIALIDGGTRSASVRAFTDCRLMMLSRERFDDLKAAHPKLALEIVLQIASTLCTRLREANVNVDMSFFPAPLAQPRTGT